MDYTNRRMGRDLQEDKGMLRIVYGDASLGVHGTHQGKEFHYIFTYMTGGLESLVSDGKEWLYRVPKPTFWRATTDNDRGNRLHLKSGMWMAADMFMSCEKIEVAVDGIEIPLPYAPQNNRYSDSETAKRIKITYTYRTITSPATKVEVSYEVTENGDIRVSVHYYGVQGLPELPVFGMRFIMPTCADKYRYEGLSGETYPDRKAGGVPGIYEIEGLPVTLYLMPQDCGMHMDTKWLEVYRSSSLDNTQKEKKTSVLRFEMDELGFSCLPYTAEELENATHQEELPLPRRTVVCICGAVRGVGGMDSWGADVEEAYHIDAQKDIEYSFRICGPGQPDC